MPDDLAKLMEAAEQGDAEAQYKAARCYAGGQGVPQDDAEAVMRFRKTADQGDALAQSRLYRYFFVLGVFGKIRRMLCDGVKKLLNRDRT